MKCECFNCDWKGPQEELSDDPADLWERLDAGSEVPAGECPKCGALAYLVEEENVYAREVRTLRGALGALVRNHDELPSMLTEADWQLARAALGLKARAA